MKGNVTRKQLIASSLGLAFSACFLLLAVGGFAWFSSSSGTNVDGMGVRVDADCFEIWRESSLDFDSNDPIVRLLYETESYENEQETNTNRASILMKIDIETGDKIEPGSYGKISFYITPKQNSANASYNIDLNLRGFRDSLNYNTVTVNNSSTFTTLKDHLYTKSYSQVQDSDPFVSGQKYYTLSGGIYTYDSTVTAGNFDTKVASGLYIQLFTSASDATYSSSMSYFRKSAEIYTVDNTITADNFEANKASLYVESFNGVDTDASYVSGLQYYENVKEEILDTSITNLLRGHILFFENRNPFEVRAITVDTFATDGSLYTKSYTSASELTFSNSVSYYRYSAGNYNLDRTITSVNFEANKADLYVETYTPVTSGSFNDQATYYAAGPYYYTNRISNSFTFDTAGLTPVVMNGKNYYKVEFYWTWALSIAQIAFGNSDERLHSVALFDENTGGNYERNTIKAFMKASDANLKYFFTDVAVNEHSSYTSEADFVASHYQDLNRRYNDGDQKIGDNVHYLAVQLHITQ